MALSLTYSHMAYTPIWLWHLDDKTSDLVTLAPYVTMVSADGHELEYLRARFGQSIPWPKLIPFKGGMDPEDHRAKIRPNFPKDLGLHPRVVSWFGDTAKFIIANL